MTMRIIPLLTGIMFGVLTSGIANATTLGTFDPRSLAMGGTGVSQANIDHAAYYNPALLSTAQDDDDFSTLVTAGFNYYDPNSMVDAITDHQDGNFETALQTAVDTFQADPTNQTKAGAFADSAQTLLNSYNNISGKKLDFEALVGANVAIPGKTLGIAISGNARVMGGMVLNISDIDKNKIQQYIDAGRDFAADGVFNGTYDADIVSGGVLQDKAMTSTASVRGATIVEGGVSLSHEFGFLGDIAIGITPKTVQVTTFDYNVSVENSDFDGDLGKKEYSDTNIDIGIAKKLSDTWKFGMVMKNAVKKEYKTVLGNTITLKPMTRVGISHHTNWTTLAIDVDLTENERIGLTGEKSRYAAVGMEFDLSLVQLRVGGRQNLSADDGADSLVVSGGVGIYLLGLHADLAYAVGDNEEAAALQIGYQF